MFFFCLLNLGMVWPLLCTSWIQHTPRLGSFLPSCTTLPWFCLTLLPLCLVLSSCHRSRYSGDLDACVQQKYTHLSFLFLKFHILDLFIKAAEVSVVGKEGMRKYRGHRTLSLQGRQQQLSLNKLSSNVFSLSKTLCPRY